MERLYLYFSEMKSLKLVVALMFVGGIIASTSCSKSEEFTCSCTAQFADSTSTSAGSKIIKASDSNEAFHDCNDYVQEVSPNYVSGVYIRCDIQ
tara:strand:- start:445 stop:726 length:282 start_codon:yes stop_codon:yes gene_type:complete